MAEEFPVEASIQAFYDGAKTRAQNGEVDELKWVEIDGVKGVQFREANPEQGDDHRRLQWMAYRKDTGQVQLVIVMVSREGKDFERHKEAMYRILYSRNIFELSCTNIIHHSTTRETRVPITIVLLTKIV